MAFALSYWTWINIKYTLKYISSSVFEKDDETSRTLENQETRTTHESSLPSGRIATFWPLPSPSRQNYELKIAESLNIRSLSEIYAIGGHQPMLKSVMRLNTSHFHVDLSPSRSSGCSEGRCLLELLCSAQTQNRWGSAPSPEHPTMRAALGPEHLQVRTPSPAHRERRPVPARPGKGPSSTAGVQLCFKTTVGEKPHTMPWHQVTDFTESYELFIQVLRQMSFCARLESIKTTKWCTSAIHTGLSHPPH